MDTQRILEKAKDVFVTCQNDWNAFYREVFAARGIVDRECQTVTDRQIFEVSPEFEEILGMIARLRFKKHEGEEKLRVITIRIPESLHGSLREEAHRYRTSMNQLSISKLLQGVDPNHVPSDTTPNHSASRPQVDATAGTTQPL